MKKTRLLITTPHFNELGGVANHYKGLKNYFKGWVGFQTVGSRFGYSGIYFFPFDIISFVYKLIFWKVDTVLLNPSLAKKAIKRDLLLLNIAKLLGKRVVVFIHGWNRDYAEQISVNPKKSLGNYKKADAFIVLANQFKNKLISWGLTAPIYLSSTKVDDKLIKDFDITKRSFRELKFLFLSRIVKDKGIFEALMAVQSLSDKGIVCSLTVVGDGSQLVEAKNYVSLNKLGNIHFKGKLEGTELVEQFTDNNIYIFPSYHEGMPTSVLEALAFGMPIITTATGGLNDFFKEEKMGYFCDKKSVEDLTAKITKLINHNSLTDISQYNYKFAKNNFMASKVAKDLEALIASLK